MGQAQGGDVEFFSKDTWVQRDICEKTPWPFEDKYFDYSICSHTLEDLRDPLYVCSELIRVSKRGYIEVPSRVYEACRGLEDDRMVGLSHHYWLIETEGNHVQFTPKYHCIHSNRYMSFPKSYAKIMSETEKICYLFWDDSFTYTETKIHGVDGIHNNLYDYVSKKYRYSAVVKIVYDSYRYFNRAIKYVMR